MRRPGRGLAVAGLASLLIACERETWSPPLALTAVPHEMGWETPRIEPGRQEHDPFLGDGWGEPELLAPGEPVRWATGPRSSLRFHLAGPRAVRLVARVAPHGGGNRVEVRLGGEALAVWSLVPGFQDVAIEVPRRLARAGANELEFLASRWDAPAPDGRGDRRRLAVLWRSLEVPGSALSSPPRVAPGSQAIDLPAGSEIRWVLPASRALRLDLARVAPAAEGRRAEIEIAWTQDRGERTTRRLRPGSAAAAISVFRLRRASGWVELALRAPRERGIRILDPRWSVALDAPPAETRPAMTSAPGPVADLRPNILLYLVDTLRDDHVGARRDGAALTPALDRLVAESVRFERAVAQSPWTKPSVASILTGLLPVEHGAIGRTDVIADAAPRVAERLRGSGYATAAVVTNGNVGRLFGFDRGFDVFAEAFRHGPATTAASVHEAAWRWLEGRAQAAPFFLFLHVIEPHAPYDPPAEFVRRWAPGVGDPGIGSVDRVLAASMLQDGPGAGHLEDLERLYDAEVAYLDAQFDPFLERLRASGRLDDTWIVFVSDHGEEFWEHGSLTHGSRLNAEQLRVPLVIRPPGGVRPARISTRWAQHIDIFSTLLAIAGLDPEESGERRSLVPLVAAETPASWREARAVSHLDLDGWKAVSVVEGDRKFIETFAGFWGRRRELYDLASDPAERSNLARQEAMEVRWRSGLARSWRHRLAMVTTRDAALDEATERQLRALGYLR